MDMDGAAEGWRVSSHVYVCKCVRACVRVCMRACVRMSARVAHMCACMQILDYTCVPLRVLGTCAHQASILTVRIPEGGN